MSTDANFAGGAVRSKDADHLEFTVLPILGLLGVARTAYEGTKYGEYNYMLGMPARACLNHAIRHIYLWLAGDRSEPHLSHAAWNCMAAEQSVVLDPELNAEDLLGPGATVTDAMRAKLERERLGRAEARKNGEFDHLAGWALAELPEVKAILAARQTAPPVEYPTADLSPIAGATPTPEAPELGVTLEEIMKAAESMRGLFARKAA